MVAITAEEKKIKRVACLYRVSTKGQVDNNDIPLQKNACREFIAKQPNWVLVREYYEKGVSGYKLSADDRDVLQQVREDALKGLFDVLLVFMFDRLGRRDDETPFIVEWFVNHGIEVWSTQEGQQRFDDHIDKLLNYLRFWQSAGESYKTSIRVNNRHRQMVKEGLFRGGYNPYGYKLVPTGVINKNGREVKKLVIDEEQAEVIRLIYDLVLTKGYGIARIAHYLNEQNIPSPTGKPWRAGVISYILRNPIYKGYMCYGKRKSARDGRTYQPMEEWILSDQPLPELVIIPEDKWEAVRKIRESRDINKKIKENEEAEMPLSTKSPLLLTGFIRCKHCGSAVTTSYLHRKRVKKDGTLYYKIFGKYKCTGKVNSKTSCDGQTLYDQKKVEDSFNKALKLFIDSLQQVDFEAEIIRRKRELDKGNLQKLNDLQKQNEKNYQELTALSNEVSKIILGQSPFKPELLAKLIEQKEKEIQEINQKIEELIKIVNEAQDKINNLKALQQTIPVWWEVYENATVEEKKMMLTHILDKVYIGRDGLEIRFKVHIEQLIRSVGMQNYQTGRT
ncbi:MAG: site-specific recombinase [Clostridiales bacterium]|nr:site-specific recombinase [Clostridiales bacterium]